MISEKPIDRRRAGEAARAAALALLPKTKRCGKCQRELPRTNDHYDADASKPDGFRQWCKMCRKGKREAVRAREIEKAVGNADLSLLLKQAVVRADAELLKHIGVHPDGGPTMPHTMQALESFMSMFGGLHGFTTYYMAQLIAADPGGTVKQKMLSEITSLIKECSDDAKVGKPPEMMTDDEFEAEVQKRQDRMKRVEAIVTEVVPHAG